MSNYNSVQQKNCSCSLFVFVLGSFLGERGFLPSSATCFRDIYYRHDKKWIGDNRRVRNFKQSDYGNDRIPWGKTATDSWIADRNRLDYADQFIWTEVDYIGEPTPCYNQNETPVKRSCFAIVDISGIPTNDYYLSQS